MLWLNSVVRSVRVKHQIMFKGGKLKCFVYRYKFVAPCSTVNSVISTVLCMKWDFNLIFSLLLWDKALRCNIQKHTMFSVCQPDCKFQQVCESLTSKCLEGLRASLIARVHLWNLNLMSPTIKTSKRNKTKNICLASQMPRELRSIWRISRSWPNWFARPVRQLHRHA